MDQIEFIKEVVGVKYSKGIQRKGLYLCLCGKEFITAIGSVNNGHTKSCGCLKKKLAKERWLGNNYGYKHGLSYTYLYGIWHGMMQRCYNEDNLSYDNYGGRGIKVYEEWINDVEKFYNWIIKNLGLKPSKYYSIDRIDNNGNYEPGNLRWATKSEQAYNRRRKENF